MHRLFMKGSNLMDENSNRFLEEAPVGKLMGKYAVPCIISLLVGALYNIVDQIFIANADYPDLSDRCRTDPEDFP